jgi:hypothetical protein
MEIKDSIVAKLSGGSRLNLKNLLKSPVQSLALNLSGAASVNMESLSQQVTATLTGGSRVTLTGQSDNLKADLSGASRLEAMEFLTKNANIETSGGSRAEINVSEMLKARASGGSDIIYRGNPKIDSDNSGGADISREDE